MLCAKSSYKDVAVVPGAVHGYASDGVFGHTNDQVGRCIEICLTIGKALIMCSTGTGVRISDCNIAAVYQSYCKHHNRRQW